MPRISLRDRNQRAIAANPDEVAPEASPGAVIAFAEPPEPIVETRETSTTRTTASASPVTKEESAPVSQGQVALTDARDLEDGPSEERVGVYLTTGLYEAARSAYLADWQSGGVADTFQKWLAVAFDAHAALSPAARIRAIGSNAEDITGRGVSRTFKVPAETIARMRESIRSDRENGHWGSDSAWCVEAIAAAISLARRRGGGALPTAPARLPNRLVR
jgi:hypothetical protein